MLTANKATHGSRIVTLCKPQPIVKNLFRLRLLAGWLILMSAGVAIPAHAQASTERAAELKRYRMAMEEVPGYRLQQQQPLATRETDEVALLVRSQAAGTGMASDATLPILFRQFDPDGDRPIAAVGDSIRLMHADGRVENAVLVHRAYFEVDEDAEKIECTVYAPTWFLSVKRAGESTVAIGAMGDSGELEQPESPWSRGLIALPTRVRRSVPLRERAASAADARLLSGVLDSLSARRLVKGYGTDPRADSALRVIKRQLALGRIPRGLRAASADEPGVADSARLIVLRLPLATGEMCEGSYGASYPDDCEGFYVAPVRLIIRGDGRLLGTIGAWWDSPAQDIRAVYQTDDGERGLVTAAGLASLRSGVLQLRLAGPWADGLSPDCH